MPSSSSNADYNPNLICVANLKQKSERKKTNTNSCSDCKSNCSMNSFLGESEIGSKKGVVVQGSFVRSLTVEEQIDTLIVFYEGLKDDLKKDFDLKDESMMKIMEGEMNILKSKFQIQISELKMLQENQSSEVLLLKSDLEKARKAITLVK